MSEIDRSVETQSLALTSADNHWIGQIRGEPASADWLVAASLLIEAGDQNMRGRTNCPELERVVAARRFFYGQMLGMSDPGNQFNGSYDQMFGAGTNHAGPRTGSFLAVNRCLSSEGVPASVYMRSPINFTCRPENIRGAVGLLREAGATICRVVKRYDTSLRMAHATLRDRLGTITDVVEEPGKALDADARVLSVESDHIKISAARIGEMAADIGVNGDSGMFMSLAPILLYSSHEKNEAILLLMAHANAAGRSLPEAVRLGNYAVLRHVLCVADGYEYTATNVHATFARYDRRSAPSRLREVLTERTSRTRLRSVIGSEAMEAVERFELAKNGANTATEEIAA